MFPTGYEVDVDAPELGKRRRPTTAGTDLAERPPRAARSTFFAYFVGRPARRLQGDDAPASSSAARTVDDDPPRLARRPAWAKRVGGLLKRGLPVLAERIGLPWPVDRARSSCPEAVSRSTGRLRRPVRPGRRPIEIAYYADAFVVLHEAAHAWFNGGLLADRWANEAFASYYARAAAKALGDERHGSTR